MKRGGEAREGGMIWAMAVLMYEAGMALVTWRRNKIDGSQL